MNREILEPVQQSPQLGLITGRGDHRCPAPPGLDLESAGHAGQQPALPRAAIRYRWTWSGAVIASPGRPGKVGSRPAGAGPRPHGEEALHPAKRRAPSGRYPRTWRACRRPRAGVPASAGRPPGCAAVPGGHAGRRARGRRPHPAGHAAAGWVSAGLSGPPAGDRRLAGHERGRSRPADLVAARRLAQS